ncbi:MAG: UPF0489 family protein [Desulfovibrio sp.]
MSNWVVPFRGREHSTAIRLNFLWNKDNVYIMDNHRASLWCWMQHMKKDEMYNFFHIDRHTDALYSEKDQNCLNGRDIRDMDISEYLETGYEGDFFSTVPLFRWDNYIGLFHKNYQQQIANWCFATHNRGEMPEGLNPVQFHPWHFAGQQVYGRGQWIVNIDLDYFVYKRGMNDFEPMFTDKFLDDFFAPIANFLESGNIKVLTLCLSPECCGNWEAAETLCSKACSILGIDFSLPL